MAPNEKNLKLMAAGAGIGLFGSLAGAVLQLLSGLITVRLVAPVEYGLYTLAAVVVATAATLANLGFGNGSPQLLAKYLAVGDHARARGIMLATLGIVAAVSGVLTVATYGLSTQLASLFGKPELAAVLRPFALILWPSALTIALISIYRGFSSTWPKVVFDEVFNRVIRVFGLLLVALMGRGLPGIVWVTVATTLMAFIAFCIYAWHGIPRLLPTVKQIWGGRELVVFSMPLFGNNVIEILMVSASTLLLGYFKSADHVGHYNVAVTLARLLEMPLLALAFIYLPIATSVHGGQGSHEVEKLYLSSTKWIAVITLPVFLAIMLDAEFIIGLLLGQAYMPAAGALRILSLGYFIHVALGPNGMTLLAFGARRAIFLSTVLAALINIVLGMTLMPAWGAMGAAIAVAVALSVSNMFISVNLYFRTGIHPLKGAYLRPMVFCALAAVVCAGVLTAYPLSAIWAHFLLFAGITLVCLAAPLVTRSMDESDLATFSAIERKLFRKTICSERLGKWCGLGYVKY
jgi:O-antigen/teichoic acid export membrane protein